MGALMKRELDSMHLASQYQNKLKAFIAVYGILGVGVPVFFWVLGPGVVGLMSGDMVNTSILVIGLIHSSQAISLHLFREDAHRQLTFLQTLPVRKPAIVHAKFTSVLLLSVFVIGWMFMVAGANTLLSDITVSDFWLAVGFFCSLIISTEAVVLLTYFTRGADRVNVMYWVSFAGWAVLFVLSGLFMKSLGKEPDSFVFIIYILVALFVYLFCWRLAVRRVNKRGFPQETGYKADQIQTIDSRGKGD
ncbi:ABC-2 transporter permease [Lentibacillus cibarius]|uniref:ABC-2 transporter permease n=1 Tax=Lentibacillus cibarius TaxID=2583219 RepID=A0A549YJZ0_9BACI|nr:ABC-2 transporter permease [Lentibacillus cibarius]TRM12164.1 ABC-2 transporter permease [Lentibacillus cibarius]